MKPSDLAHILVVEDELHLATGIQYNLEAEGYRVTTFREGPEALQAIQGDPGSVDLLVLDLMLPGMSGYDICENIRRSGYEFPVLILSARTLPEDRTRGFEVGANQYLMKPFDLKEFISRVKNLLSQQRPGRRLAEGSRKFSFTGATIDFDTHEVAVGGRAVKMTPLELRLLKYFVDNQGRVISRSELLEKVWDTSGHLNTRAPDQFIRRLRKIFEPDPAHPRHFLTIRDAGYRFVAQGQQPTGDPDEAESK